MKTAITIYQKPTCTTCRKVHGELKRRNVDFEAVNYYIDPISKQKLEELLFKLRMGPLDLMRKKEPIYKELDLANKRYTDDHLIDLMISHPELIERPIVERGGKAIVARPPERIREII